MLDISKYTDISSFQNAYNPADPAMPGKPINFAQMRDKGVVGVCIRKTLGKTHDKWFERNWQGAGDAGLKRSVYCVPYVSFDMGPQQVAMTMWPSGGLFDDVCDFPAWDDVERKHQLPLSTAISRLLPYHYAMADTFGAAEFYTAKYIWQDFYSKAKGWQKDWGLVVANYLPGLYHLPISTVEAMVANQEIHPDVPLGWLYDSSGNMIPSHLQWEQWQISADGNGQGPDYGVHSSAIDISFRQGKIPGEGGDPMGQLKLAFGHLVLAHNQETEMIEAFAEELAA